MQNLYKILLNDYNYFKKGSLFKIINDEKLLFLDKDTFCLKKDISTSCEIIEEETALLLLVLPIGQRIKYFKSKAWEQLSKLDVSDSCVYKIGSNETPGKILSKNKEEKGITFTISLENGPNITTGIDRLKIPLLKAKPIISMFESFNKTEDSKYQNFFRRSTISYNPPQNSKRCSCIKTMLENSDNLLLSLEEKEKFLNNLFGVLPNYFEDCEDKNNLHWASYFLLSKIVEKMVTNEIILNKTDLKGNTALHLVISTPKADSKEVEIKRNQEAIVKLFLVNKADINIKNFQKDTPITIVFKKGDFRLLEIIFENIEVPIILSNHLLEEKTSILDCLIKMKKLPLATACFNKASNDSSENKILLLAVFYSALNSYKNLALEIIEKCLDKNALLSDGETLVTKLLKEKSVTTDNIWNILSNASFNFDQINKYNEYPLLLACRRLLPECVKLILGKTPIYVKHLNACLDETITSYTNMCIDNTFKKKNLSVAQLKSLAFEIAELLIKNGATVDEANSAIQGTIDTCTDQDFAKAVKHLSRTKTTSFKVNEENFKNTSDTKNVCSICMDREINCSISCGHTYCFICTEPLSICPICRQPITEKRKIYIQ